MLEAWRGGDAEAGERLFTRHYRLVKRFFRNKVGAERVADLAQDTFVAVVDGRERIADPQRFRPYLLRTAYYVFCRHLRERARGGPVADLEQASVAQLDPSAPSIIARAQQQRLLLEALRSIPVNYQVVLELHYWEELGTLRIAEVLDVPAATVRSRLQRARHALEGVMARLASSPELLRSTMTELDDWAARCGRDLRQPEHDD